jgi:hypothetical protein
MKNIIAWTIIASFSISIIFFYLYRETNSVMVKEYTIIMKNLPPEFEGFTILHLTDLHSKRFGTNQQQLLELINKQQFDLIAITGDLVQRHEPEVAPADELLVGLNSSDIYYVRGNHEIWAGYSELEDILNKNGVTILNNRSVKLQVENDFIQLAGVDDPSLGMARLDSALAGLTEDAPVILLAHSPAIFDEAVDKNIELILVGHTHGGQIRLPFLGAFYIPGQGFFPEYDYGIFSSKNTTMLINAGLGESGLPLRINMKPEIVIITLAGQ